MLLTCNKVLAIGRRRGLSSIEKHTNFLKKAKAQGVLEGEVGDERSQTLVERFWALFS